MEKFLMQVIQSIDRTSAVPISIAAVIPVYNNHTTVAKVISEVKQHCGNIIVVNDGSTDGTGEILSSIEDIHLIEFPRNRGKGAALKAAFDLAQKKGFTHALTIDADGQHLAQDIPLFLSAVKESPDTLWIGDRILSTDNGAGQPKRSRFGRRFGAFWYKFHTGITLRDTQCGFRMYPLQSLSEIICKGNRYEYEIEILIKTAWEKVPVKSIPVHLYYAVPGERVSHFRPVRDFLRISGVNSKAAMTRIFFPFRFIDAGGKTAAEKFRSLVKRELGSNATPVRAAFSLAFGVFMSIFPIHGFQVFVLLALSFILKLNRPLALLGVSASSAPFLPFIIAAAVAIGKAITPALLTQAIIRSAALFSSHTGIVNGVIYFVIGSVALSIISGILTFLIAYPFFRSLTQLKRKNK